MKQLASPFREMTRTLFIDNLGVFGAPDDHCRRHNPNLPDDREMVGQTNGPRFGSRGEQFFGQVTLHSLPDTRLTNKSTEENLQF